MASGWGRSWNKDPQGKKWKNSAPKTRKDCSLRAKLPGGDREMLSVIPNAQNDIQRTQEFLQGRRGRGQANAGRGASLAMQLTAGSPVGSGEMRKSREDRREKGRLQPAVGGQCDLTVSALRGPWDNSHVCTQYFPAL